jgi:hypothetical protein
MCFIIVLQRGNAPNLIVVVGGVTHCSRSSSETHELEPPPPEQWREKCLGIGVVCLFTKTLAATYIWKHKKITAIKQRERERFLYPSKSKSFNLTPFLLYQHTSTNNFHLNHWWASSGFQLAMVTSHSCSCLPGRPWPLIPFLDLYPQIHPWIRSIWTSKEARVYSYHACNEGFLA